VFGIVVNKTSAIDLRISANFFCWGMKLKGDPLVNTLGRTKIENEQREGKTKGRWEVVKRR